MNHDARSSTCDICGAPHEAGLAACSYCKSPYAGVELGAACPRCAAISTKGSTACVACHTPLVRGCVFCGQPSPLDAPGCTRCGEAFAGAEQRKQARDAQQAQAQTFRVAEEGLNAVERVMSNPAVTRGLFEVFEELVEQVTKR